MRTLMQKEIDGKIVEQDFLPVDMVGALADGWEKVVKAAAPAAPEAPAPAAATEGEDGGIAGTEAAALVKGGGHKHRK